jgi:hypothetical protein
MLSPVLAMLAGQSAVSQFNGSSLALLGGVVAIFRRKQAIGGWLFYFFCQVLVALLLIAGTTRWSRFLPGSWDDPLLYFLYALTNLSRTILLAEIAVISVRLLGTRQWQWVSALKYALVTYAFLTVLKFVVDLVWFPATVGLDALSLSFPCVWILYFDISRRVRRVFLDKNWQGS